MSDNSVNILDIKNIEVMYDNVILALHDVSLKVPKGKVVALLGANGAGKSTTLKAVSTMLASERGKVRPLYSILVSLQVCFHSGKEFIVGYEIIK